MIFKMIANGFAYYITHHVDPAMDKIGEGDEWRAFKKQVTDWLGGESARESA